MNFKNRKIIFPLALAMLFMLSTTTLAAPASRNNIFHSNSFNAQNNNLNLIVNDMYENNTGLVVDAYLFNTTNQNFYEITNLNLDLYDNNGKIFAKKNFATIPLNGSLAPYQGKRVELVFDKNTYNLIGENLTNITWNFTYNYK